jgi:hypothetical protein
MVRTMMPSALTSTAAGVLDRLGAFEHDTVYPSQFSRKKNAMPVHGQKVQVALAQPRGAKHKRSASRTERIEVERECWALVSEAATAHPLHEGRVGHSYLHAKARYEGQGRCQARVGASRGGKCLV